MEFPLASRSAPIPPTHPKQLSIQTLLYIVRLLASIKLSYFHSPLQEGDEVIHYIEPIGNDKGVSIYGIIVQGPKLPNKNYVWVKHIIDQPDIAPVQIHHDSLKRTLKSNTIKILTHLSQYFWHLITIKLLKRSIFPKKLDMLF